MMYDGAVETNKVKSVKVFKEKETQAMRHASGLNANIQAAIPEKD